MIQSNGNFHSIFLSFLQLQHIIVNILVISLISRIEAVLLHMLTTIKIQGVKDIEEVSDFTTFFTIDVFFSWMWYN